MRILSVEKIPSALWNNNILSLPVQLVSAYQTELVSRNLLDRASTETDVDRIYGGATQVETEEHFALRFSVSAGAQSNAIGGNFNLDHVLIGPAGVFTVETKTHSKPGGDARRFGSTASSRIEIQ